MHDYPEIRSIEAERAVIGAIILDRQALPVVLDIVSPADFDSMANRRTLEAIISLQERGQPPDPVLLMEELKQRGDLEKVGGPSYLAELMDSSPSAVNVAHHARIVKEKAVTRGIVETAQRIIHKAINLNGDGADALSAFAQAEILKATSIGAGSSGVDMRDLAKQAWREIEERHKNGGGNPGTSTGLPLLDGIIGGLRQGLLYVVAGRPGTGKTALALNIARTVAGSGGAVAFFSLEMPGNELALRAMSAESEIDGHRLMRGHMGPGEWKRAASATGEIAKLPMKIFDAGGLPINSLMAQARRVATERNLALIVVDYLQLVRPSQRWGTREQEVAEVSRSLKALAKELNVPVLAAAQLNRAVENRPDKTPNLSDLRESGAIEQDADVIVFISRQGDDGRVELNVAKHRQGKIGKIALTFNAKLTRFAA